MDATAQELIARLRRNPDDSEAFAALRAHYHRQGDYASLANLLEGWAARNRDGGAAATAFFEAGELVNAYLHDRGRAMSLYERALDRNGLHIDASMRMQEMLEDVGDHRRLLDLLERRADALEKASADPRHVAQTHQQIGEVWEHRFQRVDRAIHHYRKAFELDATLVTAIYAAREIYRNAGNLKAAASLYDMEANAETDPQRKVALLRELAHLRGEQLGDLEGSIVALKRALNQAPTDLSVMHDLATMLLRRAEHAADPQLAMEDRTRASDLLYQMAQSVPPDHGLAYAEAALDATPDHDGAMELLEQLARQTGREDLLPIRWVGYLQTAPESPASDRMRRGLGEAYLTAGQLEDAIICYEPLLEKGDAEAAERLVELYRESGREEDVVHALSVAVGGLPPDKRVARLREIIQILVSQGSPDQAAQRAREILEIDPADAEALGLLEGHLRERAAMDELRDLMLSAARVPGMSVESRKHRLREVATLSENDLADPEGAISAWRAISALDPADSEARTHLERLLEETERWDELVQVLEREALTLTDPELKGAIYKRLARIHRDERGNLMEAIEALRNLRDIRPGDLEARDQLCDALVEAGAYLEAVPLVRQRIAGASDRDERLALLGTLARVLEEHIGDDEGSFEASARILDEDPKNLDAVVRMERIDRRNEEWSRLVETLSYRAEIAPDEDRAAIFTEMGELADKHLNDLDRAAEYYGQALDLAPSDGSTLDALCDVYDRAERYRDLVILLRERARLEDDPATRAELYRRIARTLGDRVRNEDAAAEAWQEVLEAGEDEEALRYLRALAEKRDEPADAAALIGRLEKLVDDAVERRELLMDRAVLLADRLGQGAQAIEVVRTVLDDVDDAFLPALVKLAELCEELGDQAALADALERQLAVVEDDGLRVPLAKKLADLYEHELDDPERAIDALFAWSDAELTEPEPQRRLVVLLERAGRWSELVSALDSLAGIEQDPERVGELVRRAAEVAAERVGDVDGAWERLAPRVEQDDAESEEKLRSIARETGRGESLAELYVQLAQAADTAEEQHRRWSDAARVFEEFLADPSRALEAALRAFAVDLSDEDTLGEVDRLGVAAGSWERLSQVYDTLLRKAELDEQKARLLLRQARLLDREGGDSSAALDHVLRACALAPDEASALEQAEELAPRAGRTEELLIVYDRRRQRAEGEAAKIEALLRAARLCDLSLRDRERTMQYVSQAVSLAARAPESGQAVEALARELDEQRPDLGRDSARRALVDLYREHAERVAEENPQAGARLLVRAARLLDTELSDEDDAIHYLTLAASFAPGDARILDELEELAERTTGFEDLAKRLEHLTAEALDQNTAAALLKRRGRILEIELERFAEAADVFARLLALRVADPEVPHRLRSCLRRAGRHQDLLLVLERELERAADPERQLQLLREVATTWEEDLRNRWEAIEAWNRVLAMVPEDPEASAAVKRLGHSTRKLTADELAESLHDRDEVLPAPPEGAPGPRPPMEPTGEFTDPGLPAIGSVVFGIEDDEEEETTGDVAAGGLHRGANAPFRSLDDEETDPKPAAGTDVLTGLEDTIFAGEDTSDRVRNRLSAAMDSTSEIELFTMSLDEDESEDEDADEDGPRTVEESADDDTVDGPIIASSLAELGSHFDEDSDVEAIDVSDVEFEELDSVELLEDSQEPVATAPPPRPGSSAPPPPPPPRLRGRSPLAPIASDSDDDDELQNGSIPPPIPDR